MRLTGEEQETVVRIARVAATLGAFAWRATLVALTIFGGWHVGHSLGWWGESTAVPVARFGATGDNAAGFSIGSHKVTNFRETPYTGPVYVSEWKIDEKTGQLVRDKR